MKYLFLLSLLAFFSCKKEAKNPFEGYGCVYGVNRTTGNREFIRCSHSAIYPAGNNQSAADKRAINAGVQKETVSNMSNYTNWEYKVTNSCDCR